MSLQWFKDRFKYLIAFFNELEERMRYPNCDGKSEELATLKTAHDELINSGYL